MDGVDEVQKKKLATCLCVQEGGRDSMANNKGFGKVLATQRSIQESILWAGNWLALAEQ